jgi:NAD(P)-dependent dehydrogenase (short-subunit alcohol dehydrogenase family)
MSQLAGKVALVTGANKGIGYEAARQLAQRGLTVIVGARDRARGETAAGRLHKQNLDVHLVTLDVADATSVAAAAEEVGGRFGRLDVLVNNAGVLNDEGPKARDISPATLSETLDTNLHGVIRVTRAFLPLLRKSGDARIINVSSTWGSLTTMAEGGAAAPSYHISKAALNMRAACRRPARRRHPGQQHRSRMGADRHGWFRSAADRRGRRWHHHPPCHPIRPSNGTILR